MSRINVQNTHDAATLTALHGALLEIVAALNRPERDDALLAAAGVSLERALFPLLVGIARFGPIGVVDLAGRAGRDYTTVSRQVARLEELGLVTRMPGADRRVREAMVTEAGRAVTDRLDAARLGLMREVFAGWEKAEVEILGRLLQRVADAVAPSPAPAGGR